MDSNAEKPGCRHLGRLQQVDQSKYAGSGSLRPELECLSCGTIFYAYVGPSRPDKARPGSIGAKIAEG